VGPSRFAQKQIQCYRRLAPLAARSHGLMIGLLGWGGAVIRAKINPPTSRLTTNPIIISLPV